MSNMTDDELNEFIERLEWDRDSIAADLARALAERDRRMRRSCCNCMREPVGDADSHQDSCASQDEPLLF